MSREEVIMLVGAALGGVVSSVAFAFVLWLLGVVE